MISEMDEMEPPPPGLTPRFESVEQWLLHLNATAVPPNPGLNYHFAFFESPGENVLSMSGLSTYLKTPDHSVTRIEYEPHDRFYKFPASRNVSTEALKAESTRALLQFICSEQFNTSFFAKGRSITTDWNGEIWKKLRV